MEATVEIEQKYADDEAGLQHFIQQKVGERVKEFMGKDGTDYIVGLDMANKVEVNAPKLRGMLQLHHTEDPMDTHMVKVRPAPKNLQLVCGHKLDVLKIPSVNCADCWKVFFLSQKEMTAKNLDVIKDGGSDEIKKVHGEKYVKNLKRFAVFLYEMKQAGELDAD